MASDQQPDRISQVVRAWYGRDGARYRQVVTDEGQTRVQKGEDGRYVYVERD